MRLAAVAPNHLGDGIMALPALEALRPAAIYGPGWMEHIYHHLNIPLRPLEPFRADTAVLFGPSFRAANLARRSTRRIGTPTDGRGWLLTDPITARTHRSGTFRAIAQAAGADPTGLPSLPSPSVAPATSGPHIGLNPIAKGSPTRTWAHFLPLANRLRSLGHRVIFYAGPGESPDAGDHESLIGLPLSEFAATLREGCTRFISADTGAAHFAAAHGIPTTVLCTSTDPAHTAPIGASTLRAPALPCAPCRRNRCANPDQNACTRTPLHQVIAWLSL